VAVDKIKLTREKEIWMDCVFRTEFANQCRPRQAKKQVKYCACPNFIKKKMHVD